VYEEKIRLYKIKNIWNLRVELLSQMDKNLATNIINRTGEQDMPRTYN
jgi:hypothetical protein